MVNTNTRSNAYTETEERIFDAAIAIFARDGKKGTTIQEIADRAGFNKALVHYYFRSKEKLYGEVFRYILRRYFTAIGALVSSKSDFPSLLRTFIDSFIDMIVAHPEIPRFLMRELAESADVFRASAREILTEGIPIAPRIMLDRLRSSVRKKEIVQVDPLQLLVTIIGGCTVVEFNFPLLATIEPKLEGKKNEFYHARKEHLFNVLYYGTKPRGGRRAK